MDTTQPGHSAYRWLKTCLKLILYRIRNYKGNKLTTLFFNTMRGSRGGQRPPLKITKNIGFLSNIGPLKNHKATKPAFNDGPSSARHGVLLAGQSWIARF